MVIRGSARPGYVVEHPNRVKAASKATKEVVVLLLLLSAGLTAAITIGGWSTLEGARPVQILFILAYVAIALLVARWRRGLLPVAAALAIILMIFAAVSAPGWFDRDKAGFTSPALDENVIGLLCFLLVPIQLLLCAFAMRGFSQRWNVEVERPVDDRDGDHRRSRQPQPA